MQIDWPRYVKTAKEQGLTGIEVVRLIQKETNRKVNISEVKRRLAGTESSTLGFDVPGASQGTRISVSRNNFDMFRISVQTSLKN